MFNYKGGALVLTAAYQPVDAVRASAHFLNIRSATGNNIVYLSADGVKPCGFLNGGEARQFTNTPASAVYVGGTAGNILYWDVSE
jgi:hypothetical protein